MKPTLFSILLWFCINPAIGETPPNVLFIAVDDLRAWVGCLNDDYPGKIHTPNIDKLAQRGRLFSNAHVPAPKCGPCRASVLTGQLPSRLGIYGNGQWLRPNHPDLVTLPKHFKNNGYRVVGAGKIAHHTAGFNPPDEWHHFQEIDWEDPWDRPLATYPNKREIARPNPHPISGIKISRHEFDWGSLPEGYSYHDTKTADYVVKFLNDYRGTSPFFLGCGIFRPHCPWYAPKEYFDLYPLDEIALPAGLKADDLKDIPKAGRKISESRDYKTITDAGKLRESIQAYLASISFADAQIGRVIDALDRSPHSNDTIIVLWSDHGWHHGEKNHWHKWTLWEDATRIPFIIAGPMVKEAGTATAVPVSALSLYPTLVDVCSLPKPSHVLDAPSLKPLLDAPSADWKHLVLIQRAKGECAVRSRTHRYIRYADGSEELYDLTNDPHEWKNLANEAKSQVAKKHLASQVTKNWKPHVPNKSAFDFDPESYTWNPKQPKANTKQ